MFRNCLVAGLALMLTATGAAAHGDHAHGRTQPTASLVIYVGGADGKQVAARGTCTVVIEPKTGVRRVLTAKLREGGKEAGAPLNHGGQVIVQGEQSVELVVLKEAGPVPGADPLQDATGRADDAGPAYFRVSLEDVDFGSAGVAFEATVNITADETTLTVPGFKHPQ